MRKTPERIESLAAEYVLGSLKGPARRRFERWMMESYRVRQEVWFWEEKLGGLADLVPEQQPPARVWNGIEDRLWPESKVTDIATRARPRAGWFWPSWGALATAAALVLAVVLVQQPQPQQAPGPLLSGAVVQENVSDPLWLVSELAATNQLRMRPVAATQAEAGKDYELWIVPEQGNPMSLGVVPVGGGVYQVTLTDEARKALSSSRTLAISLEPAGGSPTGVPTGPILHVAKLYEL